MDKLFIDLEKNFLNRFNNQELQRKTWKFFSQTCPPNNNLNFDLRPSVALTLKTGDLGLALLWIVQSTLVRSFLEEISPSFLKKKKITDDLIGALAHSENYKNPLLLIKEQDLILNGEKSYISGGETADFLLITTKEEKEDKINSLIFLPLKLINPENLKPFLLNNLRTISHSKIILKNFKLPSDYLIEIEEKILRQGLKKWGLVERTLIIEAFLGLAIYLSLKTNQSLKEIINPLKTLLDDQSTIIKKIIPLSVREIPALPKLINLKKIVELTNQVSKILNEKNNSFPEDLKYKYHDFIFMKKILEEKLLKSL